MFKSLDENNRLVIPVEVRNKLGLKGGALLHLQVEGNKLIIMSGIDHIKENVEKGEVK